MVKKIQATFDKGYKDVGLSEFIAKKKRKEVKKSAIKKKTKRLNCIATGKCQINFEQQ